MSEVDIEAQRSLADLSICDKRVLVAQLVQEEAARSKTIHPQSYNQRAMWFLWQMAPESPAYIVAIAARVGSVVDVDALRRALQSLIDRHPALRTTLAQSQKGAVQCVADFQEVAFEQIQATDLDEAGLRAKVREAANRPFDLESGPVFRASLFSRRADDHVLLIAVHHMAFDGWSSLLFWRELRVACSAETAGKTFSLPAPTARYIDYVHWQHQLLEGEEGRRLWAYWQQELAGDLPALNLPTDRPRPPVQTLSGASRIFTLGPDLTARLRSLSQEEGTTLYTVLLAAFQVLLSLYSGQRDILVGSPVAGRRRVEFARVVGDFVNTVVIRGRCSQGLTFRQFLAQARHKVLAALEHQDFPFALLVERLNLKRDPSRSPLFQVAFDLQQLRRYGDLAPFVLPHASEVEVAFGALVMKPYFFPQQEGQFDLSLQVFEDSETILGVFKYSTDLFEESTIQRMQRDFEALLERMTSDPETAISDQSLVVGQMGLATFLSHLRKLDIKLWADGDRLRVNAPSGALTPALQSEIGRHKTDILALLKGVQDAANTAAPALRPVSRQGPLELSFAQQRLWFLDQLGSGSSVYNIPVALRASGALDLPVLQRSLDEVLRRHEALRTRFLASSGQAFQVIEPPGPVELSTLDLRGLPAAEREAAAVRQVREVSTRPFDLGRGPFLRATVLRLGEEEHILVVTTHHIAADGWSLGVLGREMRILYEAFLSGHPSPLPELPIQYADFAHWQRQWLQGARLQQQLAYWKQKLVGPLPALDLLTDHPRPAVPSSRGARLLFILCPEVVGRLKDFSNREGVTPFMTLLAAFKVLLHRYTRQEDILVGSPVAGRSQPETEGLIGFFLNNLVLRTDLSGDPTFRQLLGRVRSVALEAYANQDVPFEKLVQVLQPERDTGRLPLFQVLFSLQNVPLEEARLAGTSLRPFEFDIGTSRYDLTFELWERPEGLRVYVEYNTDLFEEATIRRMFGHYTTLLDAVLVHPECRISGLPLLDEAERRQLLGEWNATQAQYPETGIHQLFEAQAIRTPEAVAVTCEDAEIRYGELNRRANQLARHLKTLGVSPETLVGVYMERSIEMVVALLGTLKAGGAYLPLDPAFPADRLAFMVEDSGAGVLLTQARLVGQLPADGVKTVCIDADWPAIAAQGGENLDDADAPENTAYVLYTSGSTGRPKGVQVLHRGLVNFLTSMRREPGLAPEDILLSVTTLSFDIAGLEIFLPLTSGARVVLVSAAVAADGSRLLRILQNSGTTVMQATPATWRLLLSAGWQGTPGLKILCGGEAMSAELAAQLLPRGASLWNMYGPTETTIWSTVYPVKSPEGIIPIGRPIANTQIYLLDAALQPVPAGVVGELYIGGEGVARGYLNRPDLTGQRFIADPFSARPGARMYRTGDLARYRPDGNIEFLGRIDHQVKIRGYRIELGEIEALLDQHPAIGQAVVLAREDTPGDRRLVAYLTSEHGPLPAASELRSYLKEKLPDYMVPTAFVTLPSLPLTPNGKVNRNALPAPSPDAAEESSRYVAPRDETERRIAAIWEEALNLQKVGVSANFFDLGGHSLLIVQVHNRLRQAFDTDLTVAQMFQYPTVEALARHIRLPQQENGALHRAQDRAQRQRAVLDRQQRSARDDGRNA